MKSKTLDKVLDCSPLAFLMVLEGVRRYAEAVAVSDPSEYPANGLINPEAWIATAKEIQEALEAN